MHSNGGTNFAGDTLSSTRLFDAIVSGGIPVMVSDEPELNFEGILDFCKVPVILHALAATSALHCISCSSIMVNRDFKQKEYCKCFMIMHISVLSSEQSRITGNCFLQ